MLRATVIVTYGGFSGRERIFENCNVQIDDLESLQPDDAGEMPQFDVRISVHRHARRCCGKPRAGEAPSGFLEGGHAPSSDYTAEEKVINELLMYCGVTVEVASDAVAKIKQCSTAQSLAAFVVGTLSVKLGMPRKMAVRKDFLENLRILSGLDKAKGGTIKNIQKKLKYRYDCREGSKKMETTSCDTGSGFQGITVEDETA